MADELGAVIEAPEVDAVEQDINPGVETSEAEVEAPVEAKEEPAGDWRKVPAELKEFFKTPAGKAAKDAWFERNAYKEKFPEGIKQVNELTSFLDEHGGREGLVTALGELKGKADELDAISEKIANGDPSLVNDLAPETVAKLGPVMSEQWQKSDPEGWSAAMSGVMAATIQQNGIPMFLERMALMLEVGKTDQIPAMVNQLKEWAGSFQAKAQAPRTAPTQTVKDDGGRAEVEREKQQMFEEKILGEVESFRSTEVSKELDGFFKRKPNDSDAKDLAINTVRSQVIDRMSKDGAFQKSLNALLARKDKDGALKLIKNRESAAIKEIAPKVGRTIFGNPAAPKVESIAKPATKTAPAPQGRVDPRDAIFNRILSR